MEQKSKSKKFLTVAASVVGFFVAYYVAGYVTHQTITDVQIASTPKKEYIDIAVNAVKNGGVLPKEVDEVTTWTDITGTSDAIQYHYVLHDVDTSAIDTSVMKESLAPSLCAKLETRRFLDKDITMEYFYSIKDSPQVYTIAVTKADCFK